jgi:EAL domain-containing protein (putative c-di-GMP-specific phosphodiesterase class I)
MQVPGAAWIAAEDFVPWVEDSELILEMSKQALRSICLQARDWFQRDVPIPSFSIAIPTAHLLQNDFLETVLALLEETGIPGSVLELCLTEATIMTNVEATTNVLHALSARGVRFCLCGYGLAGLTTSFLRRLPVQTLQVNCKESAMPSTDGIDILRAVVGHGRRLGLAIRAKDVQSAAQRMALIEAGCHAFQGQLISRTLSREEMETISFSPLGL